jgi:uncharacterized membrane protein
VHRLVPSLWRQRHNYVAGFIYTALGIIYAVLLALVVIAVWGNTRLPTRRSSRRPTRRQRSSGWATGFGVSPQDFEPTSKAEEQLYAKGLDQIESLADARRTRLVASEEGVPGVLWPVLVFGGIATVGFTYLFGLESTWSHRLMVLTLAAAIGLVLFTVGALGHPFAGGARIGTGAFDLILERFDTSKLNDLK